MGVLRIWDGTAWQYISGVDSGGGSGGGSPAIVYVTASRNLLGTDRDAILLVDGNVTLTIPTGLPSGFSCSILNIGSTTVTLTAGGGVTLGPSSTLTLAASTSVGISAATLVHRTLEEWYAVKGDPSEEVVVVALSDETSNLTVGTGKLTLRWPFGFTLTGLRAHVTTAPSGANLVVDMNVNGSSILSTKLSIDAGEKTSTTAANQPVISAASIADDAEVRFDIDQVGSSTAGKGLKITAIGYRV